MMNENTEAEPLIREPGRAARIKNDRKERTYSGMLFRSPLPSHESMEEGTNVQLESHVWWHGEISGGTAERRLQMFGQADGLFLLRSRNGEHVLSVCSNLKVCNYLIKNKRGGYSIGQDAPLFYSLPDLVDYFRVEQGGLASLLLFECPVPDNPDTGKYTDIGGDDEASQHASQFSYLDPSKQSAGVKRKKKKIILTKKQKRERKLLKQKLYQQQLQEQLANLPAYTPYWSRGSAAIMAVILVAQLVQDGIVEVSLAPIMEPKVLYKNMSLLSESFEIAKPTNVMIGPANSELIHFGAKFGPCMREDIPFKTNFAKSLDMEQNMALGCCTKPIGGTSDMCGMSSADDCAGGNFEESRFCSSSCQDNFYTRPCCYYDGRCEVTSKEYCVDTGGVPSDSGQTCATATCLSDICGMGGVTNETPDQWYRFFTPIFVHSGVLHYAGNMMLQLSLGAQIERVAGTLRTFLIYMIAGVGGYLTSGVFSPSIPSVGASGAIFGLLGIAVVDLLQSWRVVKNPCKRLFWTLVETAMYLMIGTLPFIDNWAHIGGFFFGILAAIIFLPYLTFGLMDSIKKRCMMMIAIPVLVILFFIFLLIFYEIQNLNGFCPKCKYIQCLPYTSNFCDGIPGWNNDN